jgi:hypothetical protein
MNSTFAQARAEALRAFLLDGAITLDDDGYRSLLRRGFTRRDVTSALDLLAASGEVLLEVVAGGWLRAPGDPPAEALMNAQLFNQTTDGPQCFQFSAGVTIPAELRERAQWVLWRVEIRTDKNGHSKPTKVPYQITGIRADSTSPGTWSTFQEVIAALAARPSAFNGIGFVFAADDPYCGIDLDRAIDSNGNLKTWAAPIIAKFAGTYMEISPSGRGVKLWCVGKLPGRGKQSAFGDNERVETYDRGRFFAMTRNLFSGGEMILRDHQAAVDWLYQGIVKKTLLADLVDQTQCRGRRSRNGGRNAEARTD